MGIFFALLAALLASLSNFCLRRSIDAGGSSKAYLVVQLTFSFVIIVLLNPVRTGDYEWSSLSVSLGLCGGIIFGFLMWGLGKTLEKGPSGLSFAVLNTSSVMPAVVLSLFFGPLFNHPYTLTNGVGSLLVVAGLVWAGWTSAPNPHKGAWTLCAAFIFTAHTLFLVFLQWWAMLLNPVLPPSLLLPFDLSAAPIQWFMPAIFFAGTLIQWGFYLTERHRFPKGAELSYGIMGGIANGACTFFLILATRVALPWENAMIFPVFSVGIILICNSWSQILYKETINWRANLLALTGLVIGTVAWQSFAGS